MRLFEARVIGLILFVISLLGIKVVNFHSQEFIY